MGAFGITGSESYLRLTSVMHLTDPLAIDIPMKTTQEGLSPSYFVDFGGIMTVVSTKMICLYKDIPNSVSSTPSPCHINSPSKAKI